MRHADVPMLVALARGEAPPEVEAHVLGCERCRDLAAVVSLELEPPRGPTSADTAYEDLRLVGKGGMGEVYLARDRRLGREVILKRPPRTSDGVRYLKLAARLEHERAVLARLNHPAIPPVLEGGQLGEDDEPFFAMPVAGIETLTTAVARLPTLEERVALLPSMISAAGGVAYAHRQGVIHRDIKPDHVMLDEGGEARLVDWGLAKVLDEPCPLDEVELDEDEPRGVGEARRGQILATVQGLYTEGYSPPEQREGAPAEKHFDVYALGATLYFLVTGQAPAGPSPRRALFPRSCPGDLVRIIQKAMHRDPAERYRDAGELTRVLEKFQAGRLVHPSWTEVVEDWVRRHAVGLVASAVAGTALLAGILLAQHQAELRETSARFRGELERIEAHATAVEQETLEDARARLERELQVRERAEEAKLAKLHARLEDARRELSRRARQKSACDEARARAEERRELASAVLELASATALELQTERARWAHALQRAEDEVVRQRALLVSTRRRLEAALADRREVELSDPPAARAETEPRRTPRATRTVGPDELDHMGTPLDLRRVMPQLGVTRSGAAP